MKFAVGVMLMLLRDLLGRARARGVDWPGGDAILLAIVAAGARAAVLAVSRCCGAAAGALALRSARTGSRTLEVVSALPRPPRSARASARSSTRSASSSPTSRPCTGWRCSSGCCSSALNLTLRSRAFFNSLRAAYPAVRFQWRRIWGAYFAAVGFNNVVPARGGDLIKLFLTRSSIPGSRYPTVAAAFFVESIFDATVGVLVLIFAFTQGVFPKPPDFSKLSSFDISYLAEHFRLTLFLITALAVARADRLRDALGARAGVLGARAPGPDDPQRPPPLPARGRRAAGGRVAVPLRRLLVPARRVPRRRLGEERAARVRRQPGRRRRAVHARRRRRAAGAARQGLRRRGAPPRSSPPTRSASRSRSPPSPRSSGSARSSSSSASAPSGRCSHAGRASRDAEQAAERAGTSTAEDPTHGETPDGRRGPGAGRAAPERAPALATEGPRAPRARAPRPRGRRAPSPCGSARPGPRRCPGR